MSGVRYPGSGVCHHDCDVIYGPIFTKFGTQHRRNLRTRGTRTPTFWRGGTVPPTFWVYDRKNNSDFPSSSAHVTPYNIQENVWRLGLCPRNRVGARAHIVLFKELNKYNLGNWSLMFASISGQIALASLFSSHVGPHLPLLFKLQ